MEGLTSNLWDFLPQGRVTFEDYDRENPHIWLAFEARALHLIELGRNHLRSKRIFEDLRDDPAIKTKLGQPFKVDNTYSGQYARKFMKVHPEFEGIFEIRGGEVKCPKNYLL